MDMIIRDLSGPDYDGDGGMDYMDSFFLMTIHMDDGIRDVRIHDKHYYIL